MNQNLTLKSDNGSMTFEVQPTVIEDYVFDTDFVLPKGNWELHITKGDAWIFSDNDDFLLHTNETAVIPNKGTTRIKSLYTKGMVKFIAYPC